MSKVSKDSGEDQAILNAKRQIAIQALSAGVDGKLPTNAFFKQQHNIVAGTMQRALTLLSDTEALKTRSRGHQGRVITHLDVGLCWNIAKLKPLQLLMPSSGSIEIDVLIRHFTAKLSELNIPYFISNQPGALDRIAQVEQGKSDITLASSGAAEIEGICEESGQMKVLKPNTYYCLERLVIISGQDSQPEQWRRIAIDRHSTDHLGLTQCEFPRQQGFDYIESDFRQIPARVLRDELDAGIWHMTGSPVPLSFAGLKATPLTGTATFEQHQKISSAAFITNPKRPELNSLLSNLDSDEILAAQTRALKQEDPYNRAF